MSLQSLHLNKPALRVLGIAESFVRSDPISILAGAVMRADLRVDGLAYARATVGGDDATDAIINIYRQLDRTDVNALLLSGLAVSWFNIIDLRELWDRIQKPVICLTYEESPGLEDYIREYFPQPEEKLRRYEVSGERSCVLLKTGFEVYVRALGATIDETQILLNKFTRDGRVPEPVRVARMMARAGLRAGLSGIHNYPPSAHSYGPTSP